MSANDLSLLGAWAYACILMSRVGYSYILFQHSGRLEYGEKLWSCFLKGVAECRILYLNPTILHFIPLLYTYNKLSSSMQLTLTYFCQSRSHNMVMETFHQKHYLIPHSQHSSHYICKLIFAIDMISVAIWMNFSDMIVSYSVIKL